MAAVTTPITNASNLNIYGSGSDLTNAQTKYNGIKGVNFVNTSEQGFDPTSMSNGIMLGGTGVNKNISDTLSDTELNNHGIQRVWGQTGADTSKALDNYMSSYGKPTMPTSIPKVIDTPEYTPFAFNNSLQTYLDQAQGIMAPQKQLAEANINTQYDTNLIPQANNDTLSRGLARSSYAGNRVDQLNTARARDLSNADLQLQQQINNLAMQNYNTGYDRAYQGWKDQNANDWNTYNAKNTANQQDFTNNMSLYGAQNDSYWKDKTWDQQQAEWNWQQTKDKNDESWKHINYDNSNKQYQEQFDYKKEQDQKAYELQQQQLALSQAKAASSGRSSSSKSSAAASKAEQTAIDNAAFRNFQANDVYGQQQMLNDKEFINSVSPSTYKSLKSEYEKNLKNQEIEESDVSMHNASQPTWNYSDSPYTVYSGGR